MESPRWAYSCASRPDVDAAVQSFRKADSAFVHADSWSGWSAREAVMSLRSLSLKVRASRSALAVLNCCGSLLPQLGVAAVAATGPGVSGSGVSVGVDDISSDSIPSPWIQDGSIFSLLRDGEEPVGRADGAILKNHHSYQILNRLGHDREAGVAARKLQAAGRLYVFAPREMDLVGWSERGPVTLEGRWKSEW